jgi:hypothetical protein
LQGRVEELCPVLHERALTVGVSRVLLFSFLFPTSTPHWPASPVSGGHSDSATTPFHPSPLSSHKEEQES